MTGEITRRDLMRHGAIGALGLAAVSGASGSILAACGSSAQVRQTSTPATFLSPPTTYPPETGPDKWWLEGGFAPVREEIDATDLAVTGSLPSSLSGLYVRNGSNP